MNFYKNNIKKIVLLLILLINVKIIDAQELRAYNLMPEFYIPAFNGVDRCSKLTLHNNIAPLSSNLFLFSNHLYANLIFPTIRSAVSILISQKNYPYKIYSESGAQISYVYHLKLSANNYISFSVPVFIGLSKFNASNAITPSMIDEWGNVISNNNYVSKTTYNYKVSFSSLYYNKRIKLGLFVSNLYSNAKILDFSDNKINIFGSYIFDLKNNSQHIDLSTLLMYNRTGIFNKISIEYSNELLLSGISYAQNINRIGTNLIGVYLGLKKGKIELYYSYEQRIGNFYNGGYNSHEIFFIYKYNCLKKKHNGAINCPAY